MKKHSKTSAVFLPLFVSLAGSVSAVAQEAKPDQIEEKKKVVRKNPAIVIGEKAPEIIGKDAEGKEMKLSDYRGKVVVINFWASW